MDSKPPLLIDPSSLPDPSLVEIDFRETSFFRRPGAQLPSPSQVRPPNVSGCFPNEVVKYEDLNLAVKCGHRVRIEEALTLRMMNLLLGDEVPTPEIFGWRISEGAVYIYMELVTGETLHECSDSLDENEKIAISEQMSQIISTLRRLRQGTEKAFLGSVIHTSLFDLYWCDDGGAGPFRSVKEFNDKLQEDALPYVPMADRKFDDPYRKMLPDTGRIVFTHADASSYNILIDGPPGARRISALIDWEQAGWYPEYWEYCKMVGIEDFRKGWMTEGWVGKIMQPYDSEMTCWAEYMLWRVP